MSTQTSTASKPLRLAKLAMERPSDFGQRDGRLFYTHGNAPCGAKHRDSEALDRSNHRVIFDDLHERFPEDVEVGRYGHWAVGWLETILVRVLKDPEAGLIESNLTDAWLAACEWQAKLADYPVADEEDYSSEEESDWDDSWSSWLRQGFEEALVEHLAEGDEDRKAVLEDLVGGLDDEVVRGFASDLGIRDHATHEGNGWSVNMDRLFEAKTLRGRDHLEEVMGAVARRLLAACTPRLPSPTARRLLKEATIDVAVVQRLKSLRDLEPDNQRQLRFEDLCPKGSDHDAVLQGRACEACGWSTTAYEGTGHL